MTLLIGIVYWLYALTQAVLVCRSFHQKEVIFVFLFALFAPIISILIMIDLTGKFLNYLLTVGK
jgi:hypothetical protein